MTRIQIASPNRRSPNPIVWTPSTSKTMAADGKMVAEVVEKLGVSEGI